MGNIRRERESERNKNDSSKVKKRNNIERKVEEEKG